MDWGAVILLGAGVALWYALNRWILPNLGRTG
jgi:hypothetical protein